MKKLAFVFALFMAVIFTATAQDNIIFTDGSQIEGIVQEIGPEEIVYVKADNPEGPVYKIYRSTVFLIQFKNGTSEVITPFDLATTTATTTNTYTGRPRLIGSEYKSPGLAFLFSFLMPGGGQYYNRQFGKGAAMTTLWAGGIVTAATAPYYHNDCVYYEPYLDPNDPNYYEPYYDCYYTGRSPQRIVGNVVWTGSWLWSMIDAPISAARINRRNADANTAGILDFQLNKRTTLHLDPFRSIGLGGSVALNF